MRRYLFIVLFVVTLALPFALRKAVVREQPGGAPAGAQRLVVVTPHTLDIRQAFGPRFAQWYLRKYGRSAVIDFRVPGGSSDVRQLLDSLYAPYRNSKTGALPADVPVDIDCVWGGGDFIFNQYKSAGELQPLHLDPTFLKEVFPQPALAGVPLYDPTADANGTPTPQWVGVCLSSFGIIYNPDVYDSLGLPYPRTWHDLTNPRLFNFIALADPAHSGSVQVAYTMVLQRRMADAEEQLLSGEPALAKLPRAELRARPQYQAAIARGWKRGMGELLLIAANARYFVDSSPLITSDVSSGEAAAGVAIDFYARVTEGTVGPERARFVAPAAATATTPDPVAVLKGVRGQRLELASRFVEFLLTPDAQRLWILKPGVPGGPAGRSPRRMPIRKDVYADRANWEDDFDPFQQTGNFNQRGEWMALMRDTTTLWDAAWIDSRDALRDAYRRVLSVPSQSRRAALLAELADLPVTMQQVRQLRLERERVEKDRDIADEWKARQRIAWARRFREHYERVARLAQAAP